jgi:hypothetical protein
MTRPLTELRWHAQDERWACHEHSSEELKHPGWVEIDALCRKLSALLDLHDKDRFSMLLRYGR